MIDRQVTFDTAVGGVLRQGRKSLCGGQCKYRHGDLRCVAGHLLPDEKYTPDLEGWKVTIAGAPSAIGRILQAEGHDLDLVRALQDAHDDAGLLCFIEEFKWEARKVAAEYGLKTDVLDTDGGS